MSESEEMYLVTIARLQEAGTDGAIPLARLAEELAVGPVSANQMVRKLEDCGLVVYTPYKGVDLSPAGRQTALSLLRYRRMWEVFLVEHLHYSPSEAETLACRMEHVFSAEGIERLSGFLGHPVLSPAGLPIPEAQNPSDQPVGVRLDRLTPGEDGTVESVQAGLVERSFLSSEGIFAGSRITLLGVGCDGTVLLKTQTGSALHLSAEIAQTIWVR